MHQKLPKLLLYFIIILIPFWLLFFNSPFWHDVKTGVMSWTTASVVVVRWPVREVRKILSYRRTWREHQKVQGEINALKARLGRLEDVEGQNVRYRRLLKLKGDNGLSSAEAALVIARDPTNWNASFMIDKGVSDGIKPGMPVINAAGVVGKVAEVSGDFAKVILVQDPGFSVAVVDRRSRESALLSGSLSGACRLRYLSDNADILVGDEIVTSSLSKAFPDGLLLGTVTAFYPGSEGRSASAVVDPAVDVAGVEEVLVVK